MGCNTSKESVQPAADEAKEDVKNGDIPKASESSPTKVDSAKSSQEKTEESKEEKGEEKSLEKDKDEAATRIQAAFRGHHARKSMKESDSSTKTGNDSNSEPTKEQLQEEFRADDQKLCEAATKIQASFRGHMSRKEQAVSLAKSAENFVEDAAAKVEETVQNTVNELEGIDLTDPDLHKAATKIQASFRGHKVRQEVVSSPPGQPEEKN